MRLGPSIVLSLVCAGCAAPSAERWEGALAGGETENGYPATVLLFNESFFDGGLCSGSVIAPRVVVSAKHCFDGRGNDDPGDLADWEVLTGPVGFQPAASYGIEEVLTTPGDEINNFDIEIVITDSDIDVTPYELRRDFDGMRIGDSVLLSGYGENPGGGVGRKYSGQAAILGFGPVEEAGLGENEFVTEGAAACGGDSGGTVLDSQDRLIGVIVRGASAGCGDEENTTTAITRVDHFLDLIDEGLQRTGICVATGEEVCDGLDNDCDGQIDPGCVGFLESCDGGAFCLTGTCHDLGDGGVCTTACDVAVAFGECPEETFCRQVACGEAYCSPGTPGGTRDGVACAGDTECSSLRCRTGVCRAGCQPGLGQCQPGEACAPDGEACDSCLPAEDVAGPRGLGEPCAANSDCDSGACANVPGDRYCTTPCVAQCPAGYHCAGGGCLRGDPGEDGEPCAIDEECASGACVEWPDATSCSSICDRSRACPENTTCEELGDGRSACRPDLDILGDSCEEGSDCFGGLCINFRGDRRCSEPCDVSDPCPTDHDCLDAGDGVRVCAPPPLAGEEDPGDGGCGCRAPAGRGAGAWILLFVLFAPLLRRRLP